MRFLFVVSDYDTGGITASLKNLTTLLANRGHEVELLDLPKLGRLPDGFDNRIKIVPLEKRSVLWNLSVEDIKRSGFFGKIKYSVLGFFKKIMNRSEAWMNYAFKNLKFEGYDAVIGFRQSPVCFYLASRKSVGAKKIGFWHGDVDYMGDLSSWDYYLSELDSVACVSNATRDSMMNRYPQLGTKPCTVYNTFNECEIKRLADSDVIYNKEDFNIVTVARIEFDKKQLQFVPEICRRLKNEGVFVKWHIVGDGPHRKELERLIEQNGVEKMVILHGTQSNPFVYIKNADLFVLTSIWETYGMVVVESLICGTPVVAGYYPALPEILSDGENGLIAENSVDGIYDMVKRAITDKELYKKIKLGVEKFQYSPLVAYEQFMEMMENA